MWEDDFDLESLHSDSTEVNVGSCGGLDLSGMGLSSAYFKHIQPFMAHLKCLRLHASFYPGHNPSEQLAHLITLAATLKRLDLWFDAPAASLFRSLAARQVLPELAELTLAGLVTDLASAKQLLQRLSPNLTQLTLCHIMLEDTTLSKDGWVTLLNLVAKSTSLHSLTLHSLGVRVYDDWKPLRDGRGEKIAARFNSDLVSKVPLYATELRVGMDNEMLWISCSPNTLEECLRQ